MHAKLDLRVQFEMDDCWFRLGDRRRYVSNMWPFSKTTRRQLFIGDCRHCGGRLVDRKKVCRNRVSVVGCDQCDATFDRSYSPSDVFVNVQSQRRDCSPSPIKEILRDSQLSPTKYVREQYWIVYELSDGLIVYYDSDSELYDIRKADNSVVPIGDVQELFDWLADNTTMNMRNTDG